MPDFSLDTHIHPDCQHPCIMGMKVALDVTMATEVAATIQQADVQESVVF